MNLIECAPSYMEEKRRVFSVHVHDPRYPKPLTTAELMHQISALRYHQLTDLVPQIGGGGKLGSQFRMYVQQCNCACWPNWQAAWKDFAVFMKF